MVAGGFDEMSYTTRLIPWTSLVIRLETDASSSGWKPRPVRRHRVDGAHAAKRDGVLVGALVAHHADALDGQEDREGLPDLVVDPRPADLLDQDRVGLAQRLEPLAGHLADDADSETGARKGVAAHDRLGEAEEPAGLPALVLEQLAKGLDQA